MLTTENEQIINITLTSDSREYVYFKNKTLLL